MGSTIDLLTTSRYKLPYDLSAFRNALNRYVKMYNERAGGVELTVTAVTGMKPNGHRYLEIQDTNDNSEPIVTIEESVDGTAGYFRYMDDTNHQFCDALLYYIDDENWGNYCTRYSSDYPFDKEYNSCSDLYEVVNKYGYSDLSKFETEDLSEEELFDQFLSYAASTHDSEDFVCGATTPAEAALEFIAKNPKVAKFGPKLVNAYSREEFVQRVDQIQADGDEFLRYDIDEVADRSAPASDYVNANKNAEHYDSITTAELDENYTGVLENPNVDISEPTEYGEDVPDVTAQKGRIR
jgi:hypothetical protein